MFKIRWMTNDRTVLTPAGRFRGIDGAVDRARRLLPGMANGFGVTRAEVIDQHGVGVVHVRREGGTTVTERQRRAGSRAAMSATKSGASPVRM